MNYKAILVKIDFSEALFKVHYTKGFRGTYLIPLPTSVAGVFGGMLGVRRESVLTEFGDCLFGAKMLNYEGISREEASYVQYKSKKEVRWGVAPTLLLNKPSYLFALAGNENKIKGYYNKLRDGIVYYPYGGQNDYFAEYYLIQGIEDVVESRRIENYAPQDLILNTNIDQGGEIQILPVRHRLSSNPNFIFVYKGVINLKEDIAAVNGIGLYTLEKFEYLHR